MFYLLILTIDDILFDFLDFGLSDDESEPKLSLASNSDKDKEEEEDERYNMPSDSNSDLDDGAPSAPPILSRSGATSASAFRTNTPIYKEHSIGARIKALTILNDKVPMTRIIKVIGIGRTRIYDLIAKA